MFVNNVAQFGHHGGHQIQIGKCLWPVCTCSKHFSEHLLLNRMLSNLAIMSANNSTHSGKSFERNMRKSLESVVTSMSLVTEIEKELRNTRVKKVIRVDVGRVENRSTPI